MALAAVNALVQLIQTESQGLSHTLIPAFRADYNMHLNPMWSLWSCCTKRALLALGTNNTVRERLVPSMFVFQHSGG